MNETTNMERRSIPQHQSRLELRQDAGNAGPGTLEGYGAVFNSPSVVMGGSGRGKDFREIILPGAFDRALEGETDVVSARNHDPDNLLGRQRNGTLALDVDGTGLRYTVDLPDTSVARDTATLAERGDLAGSSFTFRVASDGDRWKGRGKVWTREIHEIATVGEIGPVTRPAYLDTTVSKRAMDVAARLPSPPKERKASGKKIDPDWVRRQWQTARGRHQREKAKRYAFHEAGHQLVAALQGADVDGAELRWRNVLGTWKPVGGLSHRSTPGWSEREFALSAVAGVVAEEIVAGEEIGLDVSRSDRLRVERWLRIGDSSEDELRAEARKILDDNSYALDLIASRILEEGSISGEEVREIVDAHAGKTLRDVATARSRRRRARKAGGWW